MTIAIEHHQVVNELFARFGESSLTIQPTADNVTTLWTGKEIFLEVLRYLKTGLPRPYRMLFDISAIDERVRNNRQGQPESDFTMVYQLFSFERNEDLRIKVPLKMDNLSIPTCTGAWKCANWYEREVFDLFGIVFRDHPELRRIMMPEDWQGHPLRKDYPVHGYKYSYQDE